MNENKQIKENNQIEQMAKDMYFNTFCPHDLCENCFFKEKCKQRTFAKNLVKQGYRKQSDIAQEIIDKIMEVGIIRYNSKNAKEYYEFEVEKLDNFINQLEKEYGVED